MPEAAGRQALLDRFSRELDLLEKRYPMAGSYERVDPYVVRHVQGGIAFDVLVYHRESQIWFDNANTDWYLKLLGDGRAVRPDDVILDIGCNSGFLAVWFGLATGPGGRVLGFDPYPWNTLATRYAARLNGLDNVETTTVGISDVDEWIELPLLDARTHGGTVAGERVPAELHALARYARVAPDIIKLDVEGAESEIARTDWSRFPGTRLILLELHAGFIRERGLSTADCLARFRDAGYELRRHGLDGPVFAADDPDPEGGWFLTRPQAPAFAREGARERHPAEDSA